MAEEASSSPFDWDVVSSSPDERPADEPVELPSFAAKPRAELELGDRINLNGHFGTIRFIGPIEFSDGENEERLGIEWDDVTRGKHNGVHNDAHYFYTRDDANSGSFLKKEQANFKRCTFEDAYRERYSDLESTVASKHELLPQAVGQDKAVELIGMNKVAKQIEAQPFALDLTCRNIVWCGEVSEEVRSRLTEVTELNLSHNLFNNWIEIVEIAKLFPKLKSLVLTGNVMEAPADFSLQYVTQFKKALSTVKSIVLGGAMLKWHDVRAIESQFFPSQLESLELFKNNIAEIPRPHFSDFLELRHVDLSNNPITDWGQVLRLGHLPKLTSLTLNECDIKQIRFDGDCKTTHFPCLKTLSMKATGIASYRDVAELNKLPALEELNLQKSPIMDAIDCDYDISFNFIVCRIENLKVLNREEINESMRKEAALYYLKIVYNEWLEKNHDEDYAAEHPLVQSLLSKYGSMDDTPVSTPVKSTNIFILLKSDGGEVRKKLPASTTISKVKALAKRTFNYDPLSEVTLTRKTEGSDDFALDLNEESQSLDSYSVNNDDIIYVKPKA